MFWFTWHYKYSQGNAVKHSGPQYEFLFQVYVHCPIVIARFYIIDRSTKLQIRIIHTYSTVNDFKILISSLIYKIDQWNELVYCGKYTGEVKHYAIPKQILSLMACETFTSNVKSRWVARNPNPDEMCEKK